MMIKEDIKKRILILDGALGTMLQKYNLCEADFRGDRFKNWSVELKGCNDVLVITRPDIIKKLHIEYLAAGADIITTNSFNSNSVSLAEYGLEEIVYELNFKAAELAKAAIEEGGYKNRYVAGSVGPTGRTASMSPTVDDAAFRNISFGELYDTYAIQIEGLIDGGADVIILETIFDTLNAKAAIMAHNRVCELRKIDIPLMISGTITDNSGRTLSGQTVEAFVYSLLSSKHIISFGLNCAFGAELIYPYLKRLEQVTTHYVSVHPNAGLPDAFGNYSHTPQLMAQISERFISEGLVNIIGGCCGTTPKHIELISKLAKNYKPRTRREPDRITTLTGLEPLRLTKEVGFINIGERANVAGSAKFARLIREENYSEALSIVAAQVETGASVIDICMDDAMIDSAYAMRYFLNLIASEPEIARLPIMIDSSKWEVLEAGLRTLQGKAIVNSISLKEGEAEFVRKAMIIKEYGAAIVVMLFDEQGQADSYSRKIEVASRAYNLLVESGFNAEDIIFDPNVLTIGTGIEEHNNYGVDFIRATAYIKENLPYAKVSAGVSNLSFAFRGNNRVREAMHSAFLYHAISAGLDMAIVNAANLVLYDDIDKELLSRVEDLIFNRRSDATERILEYSATLVKQGEAVGSKVKEVAQWRSFTLDNRIEYALTKGVTDFIETDINEAVIEYKEGIAIIEGPLMNGMRKVGELFSQGKMFLPQVVKSARVMKIAVEILTPYISQNSQMDIGKIVLATVKGDVHDIGKNIVSIILSCNGFEVVDLGVMVSAEKIVEATKLHNPKIVALSGLITPSLDEMKNLLELFNRENIDIPVLVGGATTSPLHTAVKLAPTYNGFVWQSSDASSCAKLAMDIVGSKFKDVKEQILKQQDSLRDDYLNSRSKQALLPLERARSRGFKLDRSKITPPLKRGIFKYESVEFEKVVQLINWSAFFAAWQIKGHVPQIFSHHEKGDEAKKLYDDAQITLQNLKDRVTIKAQISILKAKSHNEDIIIGDNQELTLNVGRNLDSSAQVNLSLSDFVDKEDDSVGFLNVSVFGAEEFAASFKDDNYNSLMVTILADRLVEAATEYLHFVVRTQLWGYSNEEFDVSNLKKGKFEGIRPAFGYPCLQNHELKRVVFDYLDIENSVGTRLTENYAMMPQASISAMIFAHPESKYFIIKK
ncbi:MAG: methionine synthase [Rikenellaceae bacterium]